MAKQLLKSFLADVVVPVAWGYKVGGATVVLPSGPEQREPFSLLITDLITGGGLKLSGGSCQALFSSDG